MVPGFFISMIPQEDAPPELIGAFDRGDPAFRLPADADNVRLSPVGTAVAWTVGGSLPVNVDRRQRSLWVVGGPTELRRRLAILTGGDLVGWADDGAPFPDGAMVGVLP